MPRISKIFSLEDELEPLRDIAICSECDWRGPVEDCGKVKEGDWETGYYDIDTCPKCVDGGCIDDYDMSEKRKEEWQKWHTETDPTAPAQPEGVMSENIKRLVATFKKNPDAYGDISFCLICTDKIATNFVTVAGFGMPMFLCQKCFSAFSYGLA